MKCSYCFKGKCDQKYENRFNCRGRKEGVACACKCQITEEKDAETKLISTVLGVVSITGGFAVTGLTLGMGAPVGGFLMGAGTNLISKPYRKDLCEEHLEFEDSVSEALEYGGVGSVITTIGCSALNPAVATQIPIAFKLATGAFLGAKVVRNGEDNNPFPSFSFK